MTLVVRALRNGTIYGPLLRRLVYINRLYTYAPWPHAHTGVNQPALDSTRTRMRQRRRVIDFIQREILLVASWVHYQDGGDRAVALRPLGGSGRSTAPVPLSQLAVRIAEHLEGHTFRRGDERHIAEMMWELDSRAGGGPDILQHLPMNTLEHFAWEFYQFSRFRGSIEDYYAHASLFSEETFESKNSKKYKNPTFFPLI